MKTRFAGLMLAALGWPVSLKVYAELLVDDYQGVEVDGRGERNKMQAVNELADQNAYNYTLWGDKPILLGAVAGQHQTSA